MITLSTSNSWWIFDDELSRYRKIPRDVSPNSIVLEGDWQTYYDLEIDADHLAFTVFLNEEKTRILRGYIEEDANLPISQSLSKTSVVPDA